MPDQIPINPTPPLQITIVITQDVLASIGTGGMRDFQTRTALSGTFAELLRMLGIPALVQLDVRTSHAPLPGDMPFRVYVQGQECRCSRHLLHRTICYTAGVPFGALDYAKAREWLGSDVARQQNGDETSPALELLKLACSEVVEQTPAVLFRRSQAAAYRAALPFPASLAKPPSAEWLQKVLAPVLEQKISIADTSKVAETIAAGVTTGRAAEAITEDLISALRPKFVELQFDEEYLRQVTSAESEDAQDRFKMLRDGMFSELGIEYPDFRFVVNPLIKPGSFAVRVNHLTALPHIGLAPEHCLVNDSPTNLNLFGMPSASALNPANGNDAAITGREHTAKLAELGRTTWDPFAFVVLSVAADLREHSSRFMDLPFAQETLRLVAKLFPATVEAAQRRISDEQFTRTLRGLLAEQVSIRNVRLILETILDYDTVVTDATRYIVFDDRLPTQSDPDPAWLADSAHLTAFVRTGMKRQLSHQHSRGQALSVLLVDPEIEQSLAHETVAASQRDEILEAIRSELKELSTGALPALLTSIDARAALRNLTQPEFPRMPVLAYQELSADTHVQPLARITI